MISCDSYVLCCRLHDTGSSPALKVHDGHQWVMSCSMPLWFGPIFKVYIVYYEIIMIIHPHTHTIVHHYPLNLGPRLHHWWFLRLSRPSSPWTSLCAWLFWSESFGRLRMFRVNSAWWCAKNGDQHGIPESCCFAVGVCLAPYMSVRCGRVICAGWPQQEGLKDVRDSKLISAWLAW